MPIGPKKKEEPKQERTEEIPLEEELAKIPDETTVSPPPMPPEPRPGFLKSEPIEIPTQTQSLAMEKPKTEEDFLEFEKRDEEQIKAELMGELLDEFVYSFKSGGRIITGLSWAGVKEVMRRLGYIKISDLKILDMGDSWIARCKATDLVRRLELYGAAEQPKKTPSGSIDRFAIPKVVSKAQRNAIRAIIPEKFASMMIDRLKTEAKQRSKMRRIG